MIVDVDGQAAEIIAVIHWKGAVHTELRIPRRRRGYNRTHNPKEIVDAIRILVRICSDDAIAGALSRSGLVTGRGNRWTRERVTSLRSYHGIPAYSTDRRRAEGWLTLTEAAEQLHISGITLRLAIQRGEVEAEHPAASYPTLGSTILLGCLHAGSFGCQSGRLQERGHGIIELRVSI